MSPAEDRFAHALSSDRLKAVYGVWKDLAKGRIGPRRADVTPAHLRRATAWTFTVEVVDSGKDFRIGFTGDQLTQFFEQPCQTVILSELKGIAFFDEARTLFQSCVRAAKPLRSGPKPATYSGKEHLEREVLLLPLSEDGAAITGLLGAFDTWRLGTHPHNTAAIIAD